MRSLAVVLSVLALVLPAGGALAACGGPFPAFVAQLQAEAHARGHSPAAVAAFFRTTRQDSAVLRADRSQGVFSKPFLAFSKALISRDRMTRATRLARDHARLFDRAEREFGTAREILLAFWAFETDFGAVQGDFNTRDALVTLAHDCRRPDLFRPQVFAALALAARGAFDPDRTTGAWAGEIGQVQMLPADILERGVDGDGDGRVTLKTSVPDAILSGARVLRDLGWRRGEPWLQEVTVPQGFDWALSGLEAERDTRDWARLGITPRTGSLPRSLPAALIAPQGRKGPVFLAYPNFKVLFGWNRSLTYVTTAAYFATRLGGAPVYLAGTPDPALSDSDMIALQRLLTARGHDVGGIDGILGAQTRSAVQKEQIRLGLPADAWPTAALINRLGAR